MLILATTDTELDDLAEWLELLLAEPCGAAPEQVEQIRDTITKLRLAKTLGGQVAQRAKLRDEYSELIMTAEQFEKARDRDRAERTAQLAASIAAGLVDQAGFIELLGTSDAQPDDATAATMRRWSDRIAEIGVATARRIVALTELH